MNVENIPAKISRRPSRLHGLTWFHTSHFRVILCDFCGTYSLCGAFQDQRCKIGCAVNLSIYIYISGSFDVRWRCWQPMGSPARNNVGEQKDEQLQEGHDVRGRSLCQMPTKVLISTIFILQSC